MEEVLITDSLFIFPEHEKQIQEAGFNTTRLDKPEASEEELCEAIKGKAGYILGGVEKVTDSVIESADQLKVISFTGADWKNFVPAYELVRQKGIAVTNTPDATTNAVAEYTFALMLGMTRDIFSLGRTGDVSFGTTSSITGSTVGVVGMGYIGARVADVVRKFNPERVVYFSRSRKQHLESELNIEYLPLDELLQVSDIVTLHASKDAGDGYIAKNQLKQMKDGALLIDTSFTGAVNRDDLFNELKAGRIRAALDHPLDDRFKELPFSTLFYSNSHTAFNTQPNLQKVSDMTTKSLINFLREGHDQYQVEI